MEILRKWKQFIIKIDSKVAQGSKGIKWLRDLRVCQVGFHHIKSSSRLFLRKFHGNFRGFSRYFRRLQLVFEGFKGVPGCFRENSETSLRASEFQAVSGTSGIFLGVYGGLEISGVFRGVSKHFKVLHVLLWGFRRLRRVSEEL